MTRRLFLFRLGLHREQDTFDDTDSSITESESNSEDDKTELSSSDSEIENTEATSTQAELSDDSVVEFEGFSSLFNEQESSDLVEDDASDSDDDQESSGYDSNSGDNNIELHLSDSESADENAEPTATEPVMSDELLDGLSSLFGGHEESDLGDDDEMCCQRTENESKSVDNEDADAAINYDQPQSCVDEDSLCLLDGVSTLFEDKQDPIVQSTPKAGHWETAIKSLKIVAGVAGVGLALYAAYKYFR